MIKLDEIETYKSVDTRVDKKVLESDFPVIVIGYHAGCVDGIVSAALFRLFLDKFMDKKNYHGTVVSIPVQYGDKIDNLIPKMAKESIIYLLDFSFKEPEILKLCETFKEVHIWDHHLTAKNVIDTIKDKPKNFHAIIDLEKSGASLTMSLIMQKAFEKHRDSIIYIDPSPENFIKLNEDTFTKEQMENIFRFVKIVESGDLYTFEEPDSREIGLYLKTFLKKISVTHAIEFIKDLDFEEMKNFGINYKQIQEIENGFKVQAIKKGIENNKIPLVVINGVTMVCLNHTGECSDFGNAVVKALNLPVCMWWFMEKFDAESGKSKTVVVASLRSIDSADSVEAVAKQFPGGGGHRNAAGFELSGENSIELFDKYFGSKAEKVWFKDL